MSTAVALARACHTEPTVAVTAFAVAVAFATGRSGTGVLAVAAAVLSGQLSVGWSNDYLDSGRDIATARPDKPVVRGDVSAPTLRLAALVALVVCVPLSLASGWRAGAAHLAAVAIAWAYNLRLKATVLSAVPYVVAFALLPAFVVLGLPGHPSPPWWLLVAGALLGAGANFANALPDLREDLLTGVRGLPHRLGERRSRLAASVLLAAASFVAAFGPGRPGPAQIGGVALTAALILGGVATGRTDGGRRAFRYTIAIAAVDVALLIAATTSVR